MKKTIGKENQIKKIYNIRKKIKELQAIEETLVNQAIEHIERYGSLIENKWQAVINIVEGKHPKWKEEYIKELGQQKADIVVVNTLASTCKKLTILYKGIKINGNGGGK